MQHATAHTPAHHGSLARAHNMRPLRPHAHALTYDVVDDAAALALGTAAAAAPALFHLYVTRACPPMSLRGAAPGDAATVGALLVSASSTAAEWSGPGLRLHSAVSTDCQPARSGAYRGGT